MSDYHEKRDLRDQEMRHDARKRQMAKAVKWLGVALIIGGGVYWGAKALNKPVGPTPGVFYQAQSRDHIGIGASHAEYNSNPPSGGWHYAAPAQSGIYDKAIADEYLIHNLEHGHIWIAYRPDLSADVVEKLADIAKSYSSKIIMAPRPNNPSVISIVAWEYVLNLDSFDEQVISDFIKARRGRGPESIPDFGFEDFRGKATPTPVPGM